MGFGSWLRKKINEYDEKQRRKAEERKYYEQIKREERTKELGRLEARKDVADAERRETSGRTRSDNFWEQVTGNRVYGTKRKKRTY
jgi:hypothetical protein